MTRFIAMVLTAFFARVKPVSTRAKPICMNITSAPVSTTHRRPREMVTSGPGLMGRGALRFAQARLLRGLPHADACFERARGEHPGRRPATEATPPSGGAATFAPVARESPSDRG